MLNLATPCQVVIQRDGTIQGFNDCVAALPSRDSRNFVLRAWQALYGRGELVNVFEAVPHSAHDVFIFLLRFSQHRREMKRQPPSAVLKRWLKTCEHAFISWLVSMVDQYVHEVCARWHNVDKIAPSIRTSSATRPYTVMDAEAVWSCVELAHTSKTPLPQVLTVKRQDSGAGASESQGSRWSRFLPGLYRARSQMARMCVEHVCLSLDGSTHV